MTLDDLLNILYRHQDVAYAAFIAKIIPNLTPGRFIGIRTPEYRKILKEIKNDPVIPVFMANLPHRFYEEDCLHSALICQIKDYQECMDAVERFVPYIDNWAVNDGLNPPVFARHHSALIAKVQEWMISERPYVRRFGLHILMSHFLGEDFRPDYLELAASLRSEEYYVNMMTAWLFAEALVKQWDATVPFLVDRRLAPWTHHKAIQKACESFRISPEQKVYLKTLT